MAKKRPKCKPKTTSRQRRKQRKLNRTRIKELVKELKADSSLPPIVPIKDNDRWWEDEAWDKDMIFNHEFSPYVSQALKDQRQSELPYE